MIDCPASQKAIDKARRKGRPYVALFRQCDGCGKKFHSPSDIVPMSGDRTAGMTKGMTLLESLEAEMEAWKTLDYARCNFRISVIDAFATEIYLPWPPTGSGRRTFNISLRWTT